ncbi:MAG: YdcH family protein [Holosporales bacterium]
MTHPFFYAYLQPAGASRPRATLQGVIMHPLRLKNLTAKHSSLEDKLQSELARPRPNEAVIRQIKKFKLVLRDQIHQASTMPQDAVAA